MSIVLTSSQTRFLRSQAHNLKAMLQVGGKGVTPALLLEVDNALEHHELIKIKIAAEDRESREAMIKAIIDHTQAGRVQTIGHTLVLFRPSKDKPQYSLPRG